ncbi:MAG: hypothetical protein PHE17_16410 [Thiothrix sp.]|nr:hypothetical protein [Thiothrix sp.]MDD5394599.1 hypothetical protein [Thiothrix sp.]
MTMAHKPKLTGQKPKSAYSYTGMQVMAVCSISSHRDTGLSHKP